MGDIPKEFIFTGEGEFQATRSADETDPKKIDRAFRTAPSSDTILLLVNAHRADGFAKTMITGEVATSEELWRMVGHEFVRTHRGYYYRHPKSFYEGNNPYISFKLGMAQRRYATTGGEPVDWRKGVGFVFPVDDFLHRTDVVPSWGGIDIQQCFEELSQSEGAIEPIFHQFTGLTYEEAAHISYTPTKEAIVPLMHLARKAGYLSDTDQGEINVEPMNGKYPRVPLMQGIICIPQQMEKACYRYLRLKLQEIQPYRDGIQKMFRVDVYGLTPDSVLQRYNNIYWYPQKNLGDAVKFLETHPSRIHDLMGVK